jgi:hypothetical protein
MSINITNTCVRENIIKYIMYKNILYIHLFYVDKHGFVDVPETILIPK